MALAKTELYPPLEIQMRAVLHGASLAVLDGSVGRCALRPKPQACDPVAASGLRWCVCASSL